MLKRKTGLIIGILVSFQTLSVIQTFSQTAIGKTVEVKQSVTGSNSGTAQKGRSILAGEKIRSNPTGLAHFQFNDGTKMVVGPNTRLSLDTAVYNPNRSQFKKLALDSASGALRFISGSSSSSSYEIETPVGTLGIRGTAFDLQHYRGRTYIMVVNGAVRFCARRGSCETIKRKCQYIVADRRGVISDPKLPKTGIYGRNDMHRYFPFINDQRRIAKGFQLPVNTCAGGNGKSGRRGLLNGPGGGGSGGTGTGSTSSDGQNGGGGGPDIGG